MGSTTTEEVSGMTASPSILDDAAATGAKAGSFTISLNSPEFNITGSGMGNLDITLKVGGQSFRVVVTVISSKTGNLGIQKAIAKAIVSKAAGRVTEASIG